VVVSDADAEVLINAKTSTVEPSHDHTVLCLIETGLDYDVRGTMRYDVVSVDSEQGGYLLGCLARERGEETVLFLGGGARRDGAYDLTSETRLQGFLRGWGRTLPDDALIHVPNYSTAEGAKVAGTYAERGDKRPGFVFAASDDLAVGFMHGAWAYGLQPGRDYRLVGFDGQHRGRLLEGARLTSIDVPMQAMGQTAANLLMERLANPEQCVRRVVLGGSVFHGDTA
jgi:DNA-binding LacI/PurR family transcriptional regulator